jgi:hypothetical protein
VQQAINFSRYSRRRIQNAIEGVELLALKVKEEIIH